MTKPTDEQEGLIVDLSRKWARYKTEQVGMESRIRKRIATEMAGVIHTLRLDVAKSMRAALDAGATKVSVRRVSSKNPGTMESLLEMLNAVAEVEETSVSEASGLNIEWQGAHLGISLDPTVVRSTEWDLHNGDLWVGVFEVFIRESDGKVFIDPVELSPGITTPSGLIEWLRADRANEEAVVAWVTANPMGS